MFSVTAIFFVCCNHRQQVPVEEKRIVLRTDSTNVVKLTDTMVIYESTCRGCAYEASTRFEINDSMGIIKLQKVISSDNNKGDVAGGSIGKELVLVPLKTGSTKVKLYKFWSDRTAADDSTRFKQYMIEVKD